ncbi:MAG: hypothetical protein KZQ66_12475, partial [Candidatus Thiodiazotropha sp. (ex Lucinoma aequizonata)]|nr:hypothetical protein [Candidatus Thiodiazotropha sp. (ex Lucinoma aequizonata)]MCU7887559.1 hypothetical protein [Candidatus Thiodiazotropha sp. (ex Lucinoma aequizonata)]MCU7900487.1 hypothetical protein [Candidatus Thiodiazotropha sp. (ex Lucinoma aequizonata)]MCU7902700.1 hypothetical protein [Candidatus Thiodiazotropha sp. (ex Lucinoma aequizonata)]MCU7907392.1 hypothetical protein [Candidatus Thiodiazotropha sp. (ex Lucinoma aequizonata)]
MAGYCTDEEGSCLSGRIKFSHKQISPAHLLIENVTIQPILPWPTRLRLMHLHEDPVFCPEKAMLMLPWPSYSACGK